MYVSVVTNSLERMVSDSVEVALIVVVSQIVDGEALCHCGKPAVLVVTSEPDNEPGATCYEHAMDWTEGTLSLVRRLFGPDGCT